MQTKNRELTAKNRELTEKNRELTAALPTTPVTFKTELPVSEVFTEVATDPSSLASSPRAATPTPRTRQVMDEMRQENERL